MLGSDLYQNQKTGEGADMISAEVCDTYAGFIQDIRENPEDHAPRLIMADWLHDNGHPEHSELIRVQCELEKTGGKIEEISSANVYGITRVLVENKKLYAREQDLLSMPSINWDYRFIRRDDPLKKITSRFMRQKWGAYNLSPYFLGFRYALSISTVVWANSHRELLRRYPLRLVYFSDGIAGSFGLHPSGISNLKFLSKENDQSKDPVMAMWEGE